MSITRTNPNTVFLGGDKTIIGDWAANEAITPGHLVERDDINSDGTILRWKLATINIDGTPSVALDMPYMNKGVDDAYAAGDLMDVAILHKGAFAWMFVASGNTVRAGDLLGSAGSGLLKTGATVARFVAVESIGAVIVSTRCRVEAI